MLIEHPDISRLLRGVVSFEADKITMKGAADRNRLGDRIQRMSLGILFLIGTWSDFSRAANDACTKATGPIQQLIFCQSDALMSMDKDLNNLYRKVSQLLNINRRGTLIRAQQNWIKKRDACSERADIKDKTKYGREVWESFDCVKSAYETRKAELSEILAQNSATPQFKGKPKFRKVSSDGRIIFFDENLFTAYEQLIAGKKPELEDLELSKTFVGPAGVTDFPNRTVSNCEEFFKARAEDFYPVGNSGFGAAEPYLICDLQKIFRNAQKPKTKLDESSILGKLSQASVFQFPGSISMSESMGVKADAEDNGLLVEILALSDFDGDGIEDILVQETTSNRGAVHYYYRESVLILTIKPGAKSLTAVMERCGINKSCLVGGHRL